MSLLIIFKVIFVYDKQGLINLEMIHKLVHFLTVISTVKNHSRVFDTVN